MAERWQTFEARAAAVFFRDSTGNPQTGLTPTATSNYKDGTGGAPAATVTEVANGFYRVSLASAPTKDVLVRIDGGASLSSTRYVALEVPVGGYVDSIDAATSSRASASALAAVQADTDDLQSSLTTVLTRLDVAVSTRAAASDMVTVLSNLTTLLARLTATRAGFLDELDPSLANRISRLADLSGIGGGSVTPDVRTT